TIYGGSAAYALDYADLGSRTDDNTVGSIFSPASPQTVFGSSIVTFTPPAVTNPETHTLRFQVTDAVGDSVVQFVTINIVP
ncbi:MAG: hypothetical protein HZB38_09265, partial [Planctomycetes bacterium]|nr:hypothetical protein [Planctomycetota bacterium]